MELEESHVFRQANIILKISMMVSSIGPAILMDRKSLEMDGKA